MINISLDSHSPGLLPDAHACTHRLHDGRTVTIRPIRSDGFARECRFLEGLSGESRYLRFQQWVAAPSEKLVHFLTDIDHEWHVAFVCTVSAGEAEEVVGEARYVVNADRMTCEFGVVISDLTMLRFARSLGFEVETPPDDPATRRIVKKL